MEWKEDSDLQSLQEDRESYFKSKICAIDLDFFYKGDEKLTNTGSVPWLRRLSSTPSSIIFVELSIVKFYVVAE